MGKESLLRTVAHWIRSHSANGSGDPSRACRLKKNARLPDGQTVDLIASHTDGPRWTPRGNLHLRVWNVLPGVITLEEVERLTRALRTIAASYYQSLEENALSGRVPSGEFALSGNLVGSAVERNATLGYWSNWARDLSLWTYRRSPAGVELNPYAAPEPRSETAARPGLWKTLGWRAVN